jgi:peptidoglycan/xylan/chitin deacetylase (PgdA/CDA1 family)
LSLYLHSTAGCEHKLDQLLCFLRERHYAFTGPGEFLEIVGKKTCFLSFDDNYHSWLRTLPIFERHQVHATFYVNSWPFRDRAGEIDVRNYIKSRSPTNIGLEEETTLSTAELKEIAAAGHTIGAHTHTHPVLTSLPQHAAQEEIRICKEELAAILGHPPEHFAYPFGMRRHFNRSLRNYCRSIGFTTIANAIPCMQYARSRPDSLHR